MTIRFIPHIHQDIKHILSTCSQLAEPQRTIRTYFTTTDRTKIVTFHGGTAPSVFFIKKKYNLWKSLIKSTQRRCKYYHSEQVLFNSTRNQHVQTPSYCGSNQYSCPNFSFLYSWIIWVSWEFKTCSVKIDCKIHAFVQFD